MKATDPFFSQVVLTCKARIIVRGTLIKPYHKSVLTRISCALLTRLQGPGEVIPSRHGNEEFEV